MRETDAYDTVELLFLQGLSVSAHLKERGERQMTNLGALEHFDVAAHPGNESVSWPWWHDGE